MYIRHLFSCMFEFKVLKEVCETTNSLFISILISQSLSYTIVKIIYEIYFRNYEYNYEIRSEEIILYT